MNDDLFKRARESVSPHVIESFFPGGEWRNKQYFILSPLRHETNPDNFNINETGLYNDFAYPDHRGDFIDLICRVHNLSKLESAEKILSMSGGVIYESKPEPVVNHGDPVSVKKNLVENVYDKNKLLELYNYGNRGKVDKDSIFIAGIWYYTDDNNNIIACDVRFEDNKQKKDVLTFWYNGKTLKTKNPPQILYNLYEVLNTDKPVLIVEGCKCAERARELTDFTVTTWNGGANRVTKIDWKILENKRIYIWADNDNPGREAANYIKSQISSVVILPLHPLLRQTKGGDICDLDSLDGITDWILNPTTPKKSDLPFQVLGRGEDNNIYFICINGWLEKFKPTTLDKSKLRALMPDEWWFDNYSFSGKMSWDAAISDMVHVSNKKSFNTMNLRGKGGWRERDGRISYNDGEKVHGEYDATKTYLKTEYHDIGLNSPDISDEILSAMRGLAFKLTFKTPADAVRCLSWSTLAQFGGALPWRPAFLMTAESGSGKTQIAENIIIPLANPKWLNGASSVAGTRAEIKYDTCAVIFEEMTDGMNKEEIYQMMTASTSENAPMLVKGTSDGGVNRYNMKNMFGFISISPVINDPAAENRIMMINLQKKENDKDWKIKKAALKKYYVEKNCNAIRGKTWRNLKNILSMADVLSTRIQEITKKDSRWCDSEGIILACYFI